MGTFAAMIELKKRMLFENGKRINRAQPEQNRSGTQNRKISRLLKLIGEISQPIALPVPSNLTRPHQNRNSRVAPIEDVSKNECLQAELFDVRLGSPFRSFPDDREI